MTEEQLIEALNGTTQGISAAVEQHTITPQQIYCLFNILIQQLPLTSQARHSDANSQAQPILSHAQHQAEAKDPIFHPRRKSLFLTRAFFSKKIFLK